MVAHLESLVVARSDRLDSSLAAGGTQAVVIGNLVVNRLVVGTAVRRVEEAAAHSFRLGEEMVEMAYLVPMVLLGDLG